MVEKIEGTVIRLRLSDLIRELLKKKSSIIEINGLTLIFEDSSVIEEKKVSVVGTGYHSMIPGGIGDSYETVFIIPGKIKEEIE